MARAVFRLLVASGLALCMSATAYAASKKMSASDAEEALKKLNPEIKVVAVQPAPVPGLFEVVIDFRGQKDVIYLDESRKFLVKGMVLDIEKKVNFTQNRLEEINKVDFSKIPLEGSIVMGPKDAAFKVVVLSDPD